MSSRWFLSGGGGAGRSSEPSCLLGSCSIRALRLGMTFSPSSWMFTPRAYRGKRKALDTSDTLNQLCVCRNLGRPFVQETWLKKKLTYTFLRMRVERCLNLYEEKAARQVKSKASRKVNRHTHQVSSLCVLLLASLWSEEVNLKKSA